MSSSKQANSVATLDSVPQEAHLALLSLDYLRELRRSFSPEQLSGQLQIDADYLTMAIWALNRALPGPSDPFFHDQVVDRRQDHRFPSLSQMERTFLYHEHPDDDEKKDEPHSFRWYSYDDGHLSNQKRYFPLAGLSDTPLALGELVAAGVVGLGARTRLEAEQDMMESPLFEQFVEAVEAKGFFDDSGNDGMSYDAKFRKVAAKFRTKLASKAEPTGDPTCITAANEYQRQKFWILDQNEDSTLGSGRMSAHRSPVTPRLVDDTSAVHMPGNNPLDLAEAERLKGEGNTYMQRKQYQKAADAYTAALKMSPSGPQSHVYYSNRAAALVSLKQFEKAILDSERSLALQPEYGKAHARLGLAHFLMGNYRQAMEAYTVSLKYEDNASSRAYLEKAAKKLAEEAGASKQHRKTASNSFSVVSEWEKERNVPNNAKEAEKAKVLGNAHMANKEYRQALEAYSNAIQLAGEGSPQAHVYYSNRAAARCYLEQYEAAAQDSLKALKLNPTYGKAYARLGLSRFFLQDYEGAVEAYTRALELDPGNTASQSYLAKAKAKLGESSHALAQKLMNDPEMQKMAAKAMQSPDANLLDDPTMQEMAKKAMSDPSIAQALSYK